MPLTTNEIPVLYRHMDAAKNVYIGVAGPSEYMVRITKTEARLLINKLKEDFLLEGSFHHDPDPDYRDLYLYIGEKDDER